MGGEQSKLGSKQKVIKEEICESGSEISTSDESKSDDSKSDDSKSVDSKSDDSNSVYSEAEVKERGVAESISQDEQGFWHADGRERSSWPPGFAQNASRSAKPIPWPVENETLEDALPYLLPQKDKLRVFRCPVCEVRVAQEIDLCREPIPNRAVLSATFTRTFNMVNSGDQVCCLRCSNPLFPFDKRDPNRLTLPLYWEGKRVFLKTALRGCSVVLEYKPKIVVLNKRVVVQHHHILPGCVEHFLDDDYFGSRDVDWTYLLVIQRMLRENGKKIGSTDWEGKKHVVAPWTEEEIKEAEKLLQEEEGMSKTKLLFCNEVEDAILGLGTLDVCFLVKEAYDGERPLCWADWGGEETEKALMLSWRACGGNVLIADGAIPRHFDESGPSTKFDDLHVLADETLDEEDYADRLEAFAQLIRDRHYVGYWSSELEIPKEATDALLSAIDYRRMLPQWRFIRDFPQHQFLMRRRKSCDIDENIPFACTVNDMFTPSILKVKKATGVLKTPINEIMP